MPQKPHTIPSTLHRGSGVLPAMVSVAAVCDRRRPQGRDASPSAKSAKSADLSSPVSIQNSKFIIQNSLPSAALTFRTLSTILHPHEHGQNPLDSRSSQHRASQGPRHCGMFGVGRQGMSDSGLSSRSSSIAKSYYEGNLQRVLDIAERIQAQDSSGDNYPLDRTNVPHSRYGQIVLTPVAAVCDRRRPQGRDASPSAKSAKSADLPSSVSTQNSKFLIQNSLPAAPSAPPRLRVNPSAILDRMTGFAGLTGVFRQN